MDDLTALAFELGRRLAELRRSVHATQADLARHTFVDRTYISHIERGRCVSGRRFWALADDHLGANGTLLAAYDHLVTVQRARAEIELDALRGRHQVAVTVARTVLPAEQDLRRFDTDQPGTTALLHDLVEATDVDRRHFLLLTSFAHDWLFDPAGLASSLAGRRIGHTEVDALDQIADLRRKLHDTIGGRELLAPAHEDLRLVVSILRNATYTDDVATCLYSTAAEFARIAGNLAYDDGQLALAQRYYIAGLRAVHLSGDRALATNILGLMSEQGPRTWRPS